MAARKANLTYPNPKLSLKLNPNLNPILIGNHDSNHNTQKLNQQAKHLRILICEHACVRFRPTPSEHYSVIGCRAPNVVITHRAALYTVTP